MSIWSRTAGFFRGVYNRARAGWARPEDHQSIQPFVYAGVRVTPEIALQVSTVWACVDVVSKAIASSHWDVYLRLRDGDRELLKNDPLAWLLNTRPNSDMTAIAFWQALVIQAMLVGDAFAEIEYDGAGRVVALWPMWYADCEVKRNMETGELEYWVRDNYRYGGALRILAGWQVFHLRGTTTCGWIGEGAAIKGANAIGLAMAQERFAATYFGNGTNVGGTLEVVGQLDQRQRTELRDEFEAAYRGSAKAHRPLVLEQGQKYTPFTPDAQKAQLTEAQQYQVENICRFFGVPPHKVGHLLRATFSNIEHLGIEFAREGLRPWAVRLQQEADYKLFPSRGPWKFVLIDLKWASQGDFKSRMEGYGIAINHGIYNVNDVLRGEGENTIGPEGDIRMVQGAMVKLQDVGKAYDKPATTSAPPSDPEDEEDDDESEDALTMSVRSFAASIYDRACRRRAAYESQMDRLPNAAAMEKRAAFLESQQAVLRRDLAPVVSLICKVWHYDKPAEIETEAMNTAAALFSVDGAVNPDQWARRIAALYRRG